MIVTVVVGICSFYAYHRNQLYYCNGRSNVLLEDRLYYRKIKYHWKINCCVGRSTVLLEDKLYYWKINCDIRRSVIFSEGQLY